MFSSAMFSLTVLYNTTVCAPKSSVFLFFISAALPSRRSGCRTGRSRPRPASGLPYRRLRRAAASIGSCRAAAGQEAEVIAHRRLALTQDAARKRDGGSIAGRVLDKHSNHSRNAGCAPIRARSRRLRTMFWSEILLIQLFDTQQRSSASCGRALAAARHLVRPPARTPRTWSGGTACARNCSRKWLIR